MYQEVLDWEPPVPGVRCILEIGGSTLITQVPDASALPPPAPPELCDPYIPLPFLPSLAHKPGSLHGAFHEASLQNVQPACCACCTTLPPADPEWLNEFCSPLTFLPSLHGLAAFILE